MRFRILALAGVLSILNWHTSGLPAQESDLWTGRPVMVVRSGAQLKSGADVVGGARLGEILEVTKTNDGWLWIASKRGWIRDSDVVLADRAVERFTQQVDSSPTSEAYRLRGIARAAVGQSAEAVADFDEAIARDPSNLEAYNERGNELRKIGQHDRALSDFNTLIERNVRHPALYTNRGLAWHEKGEYERALADFTAAVRLDPDFAPAWEAGGNTRQAKGDYAKAVENFSKAIGRDPDFARAHNNLAWLLATCPDETIRNGSKAIEHAMKASELARFKDPGYLDTLAAAYAEARQFEQAVARATEALSLAADPDKKDIEDRLTLYRAGKPYRQKSH